MKKIKKKDLIKGEIYKYTNSNTGRIIIFTFTNLNKSNGISSDNMYNDGKNFNYFTLNNKSAIFYNTTPEEKHWLEVCITANKFISYKEAMKTFIPEYVECIKIYYGLKGTSEINKIYKTSEKCIFSIYNWIHILSYKRYFKPSTKEAYDAQYVLKKQLEKPKDKVLKTNVEPHTYLISKIIKVESSEGAIYQLGDKITVFTKDSPNKGKLFTIKGFRWNNAKTNICAITELHRKNGISLDKIELYSEPVVSKKYNYKHLSEIGVKHFSTKEKAEEYILLNKPCLSFNDILNLKKKGWAKNSKIFDKIKELVEQKLNNN